MKKFIVFFILFVPIVCFSQNKFSKTSIKQSGSSVNKQVNTGRQNIVPAQNQVSQRPQINQVHIQKESLQNQPSYNQVSKQPINKPMANVSVQNQRPTLQKSQIPHQNFERENKPQKPKPHLPPARPGNYKVVYWHNFIDTQNPQIPQWATKVLDTKNLSLDGRGVNVAILDSGIAAHNQFNEANIEIVDITGNNDPYDSCGHGTAVAGIIVGKSANDFRGIAPAVNLKSYKIADESGTTNNNYIISALDNILEYNRQNLNNKISIINISYGLEQDNSELKNKLKEVYSSGVAIVAASGNDGKQSLLYPAAYDFVFAAGSIDRNKKVSDFSNWGEGLDFVLPGSGLKTLGTNNDYIWVRGTSFSSAYLTGICALATQAFKNKYQRLPSPQELYEVLKKISTCLNTVYPAKQGYGVPDASKIVSYI